MVLLLLLTVTNFALTNIRYTLPSPYLMKSYDRFGVDADDGET